MIYSYIIGWYWWWIDLLSFHYGLKPSIWRYLFCLFLKGALNSAAKKWADFLKKERLISGCVPCWAWLRLKINLRCYIVKKILNWFIFNFRNKLINVTAGASVDVCRPFKLTDSVHDYRRFELVIFPEQWRRSPWVVTLVVNTPTFLNCHLYKFVSYLKKRERASNSSLHCLHKNLVFLFAKTVVESRQAMVSNLLVLPQNGKVWH